MKKATLLFLLLISPIFIFCQNVGVGTNNPTEKLHVEGKARISSLDGSGTRIIAANSNGTLETIPNGSNGEVLTKTQSGLVYMKPVAFNSKSLQSDILISSTTFTDVPTMSVTFTATQADAMIIFSASGFAYSNAMSYVQFRIRRGGLVIGGTNNKLQNFDEATGTIATWSCNYSRKITDLVIGYTYTFNVQGLVDGIHGTYDAAIYPTTNPSSHHMSLTIMQ